MRYIMQFNEIKYILESNLDYKPYCSENRLHLPFDVLSSRKIFFIMYI